MKKREGQIIFVTGLSGSGKTTAMAALEDLSFYCVDNLPAPLMPQLLDLCEKATPPIDKVALAVDAREKSFLQRFPDAVRELRAAGREVRVIFLECADEILLNRYRETRRVHPLAPAGTVGEGIARERELLADLARLADLQIDTSDLNIHQLKETVIRSVSDSVRQTVVNVISFGFRYAIPRNVELMFDVRVLPNPYFDPELRDSTGLDEATAAHVLKSARGSALLERLSDLVEFFLPLYDAEGKAYVTLGIGCTGGQHRSVAITEALASRMRAAGREVNVEHRDLRRYE